jgi:hypothetical protein
MVLAQRVLSRESEGVRCFERDEERRTRREGGCLVQLAKVGRWEGGKVRCVVLMS